MLILALLAACADPAKDKPAAKVTEPPPAPPKVEAPAPPPAAPMAGEVLNATGTVGFTAAKITKSHDGTFKTWSGQLGVDGDKLQAVRVEVTIDSVSTGAEKLDAHLRSEDFFDTTKFPKATFASTAIKADSATPGANAVVEGDLEMHGVSKHVSFPAQIDVTPTDVKARAEFSINRQDFKITYPGKPDDLIRDEVLLKIDLSAPRSAATAPAPGR